MIRRIGIIPMALAVAGLEALVLWAGGQTDDKLDSPAVQQALNDHRVTLNERWSYRYVNRRILKVPLPLSATGRAPGDRGIHQDVQAPVGAAEGSVQRLALHGAHPSRRRRHLSV